MILLPQPEMRVGIRRLPLLPCGTSRESAHRVILTKAMPKVIDYYKKFRDTIMYVSI